jgi:hypothetical protein
MGGWAFANHSLLFGVGSTTEAFKEELLKCVRAFVNNEYGLTSFLQTETAVDSILQVYPTGSDKLRVMVLDLLMAFCWVSEEGHKYVSSWGDAALWCGTSLIGCGFGCGCVAGLCWMRLVSCRISWVTGGLQC